MADYFLTPTRHPRGLTTCMWSGLNGGDPEKRAALPHTYGSRLCKRRFAACQRDDENEGKA
ncbi:MAG TPA: hypothetical protein DEA55_06765 [Rhodospirillaceae bacterium]|nr:hypothetical protein [Rhodospirillaceae bacterium]